MHVTLLGTAAGGGFPQWNCWCPPCRIARADPGRAHPRTQSSAAVSSDGERWFLLNASPDVRAQIERLESPTPTGPRHSPVEGVVLTDGELDHTLGLVLLREARALQLWATPAVRRILESDIRLLPVTRAFADLQVRDLECGVPMELRYCDGGNAGLDVTAFPVPAGPPRFARNAGEGHTVGLLVRERATGSECAFVPGCGALVPGFADQVAGADLLVFDGTFWTDDELIELGIGDRTARQMDHVPIAGPGGSLEALAGYATPLKVYSHINNTNPMLIEDSAERKLVEENGIRVGADGMRFTI